MQKDNNKYNNNKKRVRIRIQIRIKIIRIIKMVIYLSLQQCYGEHYIIRNTSIKYLNIITNIKR